MLRNTYFTYGSVAKFFHWLIFILVVFLLLLGFFAESFPDTIKGTVINIHKLTGLTVLGLVILRLLWALMNPKPRIPGDVKWWEKVAEYSVHGILYLLLFAMPISGWVMSTAAGKPPHLFGIKFPAPGIMPNENLASFVFKLHATFAWILIALVILHVLAALKHHFINKDNVLLRMLPGKNEFR